MLSQVFCRPLLRLVVDGDGAGHADRCTVLGLTGIRRYRRGGCRSGYAAAFGTVEVAARGRAAGSACPDCGRFSDRVHDRYQRRLKDLPLAEQGFVIRLTVRRFICGSADCPRRTC
ncbi:transposase family protein [Streptomyces sp. NBC_00853]|uniref:transposase family protein n=1 Tax=Streptomyces sp. NBC_00853 TaxID=2903681 RepID=UPI003872AB76